MKFILHRTSQWEEDSPPTPDATLVIGKNPKWEDPVRAWTIEVNSLEHLMELMNKWEHSIVLMMPAIKPALPELAGLPELEIYDDYRE